MKNYFDVNPLPSQSDLKKMLIIFLFLLNCFKRSLHIKLKIPYIKKFFASLEKKNKKKNIKALNK